MSDNILLHNSNPGRLNLDMTSVSYEYFDEWSFCDERVAIVGPGWQHLGGTDFQYTPDDEFVAFLSLEGLVQGTQYLISGMIEEFSGEEGHASIRIHAGDHDNEVYSIHPRDEGKLLAVIIDVGPDNTLLELAAWTNLTISKFVIRNLGIRPIPADFEDVTVLVDGDLNYLLDNNNSLITEK